jgi:O-antigen biosynthesis protein
MKKNLRDALPLGFKLWLKRMAVGTVRLPIRFAARSVTLARRVGLSATTHGLDIHQAWDLGAKPRTPYVQQYGATDFLFLMDAMTGRPDRVPAPDRPIRTSIILLCYNKIDLTFQCLRSLLREVDLSNTEIIVVNNASTDNTKEVLAYFDGYIRVLNNEENVGFVHGNNKGAQLARGRYLLFLNNDTVVLPGWLEHLVETADNDPQVGVVGPMFIYPDGRIQEAGGIVWNNGEAFHYGWGKSPDDRRFNFAREVDYITGASILIRKDLFDRLGGLDKLYAPIYYEDTDICFGVRSLGYKVVYQPMSRIVHFEGVTAGSDVTKGLKRFQIVNGEKFREKWRDVLEREHLPRDLRNLEDASNRKRGRVVVVFDERVPSPDRDAGSLRMFWILKTLSDSCHVIFVPFNRPQSVEYERALWQAGIETAYAVDYRRLLKNKNVKAAIVSRPSMGAFIRRIRRVNPNVRIIFDMVDTHFVRLRREYEIARTKSLPAEAERYRKLERKLAQSSDLVWCASVEDKQAMEHEAPESKIEVVPTIHELRDFEKSFDERHDLLFIGNLAHRPNEDAVLFFLREVYPLVRNSLANIGLDIIGDFGSDAIKAYDSENVRVRGYVPDVEPYLRNARVFVAPLRFGAGIKGKVGEAMAHGLPVVTTSIGAEGFGLTHGLDVMIGDDPASFAEAIQQLYSEKELWQRVADSSRLRIEKHFTPEVVAETINNSIKEVDRVAK